jgi:peptidyl-prolyl cis-trans isomerase A (cyclophilin A)
MIARFAAALLAFFLTVPAAAQAPVKVALETSAGRIVVQLEPTKAPITTANFLRYVDAKRFDGIAFYRAMKLSWGGLVQAGQRDPKKLFPPIKHEPTTQTGLSHTEGTISMARFAPGSATADFTIMVGDMTGLDAKPAAAGDNLGFAAFGKVVEGLDVVKAILTAPTSATLGEGVMKGQMLSPTVKITTARRVP